MEVICDLIMFLKTTFKFLTKPEYLALVISLLALTYNIRVSIKDRQFSLQKEKYFKYQQVAEKITAKIAVIEHDRERYIMRIENTCSAHTKEKTIFIDNMDVFNTEKINKDSEEVAALLQIYFPNLCSKRDSCLQNMKEIYSQVTIIDAKLQNKQKIDRNDTEDNINWILEQLWDKPKEMINDMISKLKELEESTMNI